MRMKLFRWQTHIYHLQVWRDQLRLTELTTSSQFADEPKIALERVGGKKIVRAVGASATVMLGLPEVEVCEPFYDGGLFVSDRVCAFAIINHASFCLQETLPKRLFAPVLILQPMEIIDGKRVTITNEVQRDIMSKCGFRKILVRQYDDVVHPSEY